MAPPVRAPALRNESRSKSPRPTALLVIDEFYRDAVFGGQVGRALNSCVRWAAAPHTVATLGANPGVLSEVEVLLTGWTPPRLDADLLAAAPRLRAVFHSAGSIRNMVTPEFWKRDIVISSSYAANAEPVAAYTLGAILLSLKHVWPHARAIRGNGRGSGLSHGPGTSGSVIGFVSLGRIARRVIALMRPFRCRILAYDPYCSPADAKRLRVNLVPLDELFALSDVVSIHTPLLPVTIGLITAAHVQSMRPGATLINTARGAVVRESEMLRVLQERPDLTAVLDVAVQEPPAPDSLIRSLPNVVYTPHVAGSQGNECRNLGACMVAELRRWLRGQPLRWSLDAESAEKLA